MKLRELAEKAEVRSGYLSELEAGKKTNPSLDVLKSLARALGVPVIELLERASQIGGVPVRVEKEKWRILRLVKCTTSRPPWQAATGGTRHGQTYQEAGSGARGGANRTG
jgi:transcriptional regulator with XRE-family HTH domain